MRFFRSPPASAGVQAAAELARLAALLDLDRNREAAGAADARAFGKLRPSQAPAGGEQRQGLEEIGLAGAVLAA